MKKLILSILLIIISVLGFAQTFPIITPIGSKPTMLNNQGTFKAPGYTYASFTDTTEANASSYLKFTPGIIILTGYTNLWVRNSAATAWVQISGSGGGGGFTTANNGLTAASSTLIQLGGTLLKNTSIDAAGFTFGMSNASSIDLNIAGGGKLYMISPYYTSLSSGISGGRVSNVTLTSDSMTLTAQDGAINVPALRKGHFSTDSIVSWNSATGALGYINKSDVSTINFLGTIYDGRNWTNLNDFNSYGGGTPTPTGGNLVFSSGAATDYSSALSVIQANCLEYWKGTVIFKPTAGTARVSIGMRGVSTLTPISNVATFDMATGKATLLMGSVLGGSGIGSTSVISITAGDSCVMTIERTVNTITVNLKDITNGNIATAFSYQSQPSDGSILNNTGQFSIFNLINGCTVYSLTLESQQPKNCDVLVVGDSKFGYFASDFYNSFSGQMKFAWPVVSISAGGGDQVFQLSQGLQTLINLHPKSILLEIGSNSIRNGEAGYLARYDSCVTALENAGILVYHLEPLYETAGINQLPLENHIVTTFSPSKIIYIYYKFKDNASGYLASDGVHPNQAGHDFIYQTILNAYKIAGAKTIITPSINIRNQQGMTQPAQFLIGGAPSRVIAPLYVGDSSLAGGTTQFRIKVAANTNLFAYYSGAGFTMAFNNDAQSAGVRVDIGPSDFRLNRLTTGGVFTGDMMTMNTSGFTWKENHAYTFAPGAFQTFTPTSSGSYYMNFRNSSSADELYIGLNETSGRTFFQTGGYPFDMIGTSGQEGIRLTTAGLIGIGTTLPTEQLTVNGQIRVASINNASVFDSVIVINNGIFEARLASSIIGATPTLQQVLTAGSSISSGSQSITGTGSNLLNFTNFDEFDISNMTGNSHFGGGGIYNFDADLNVNDILKLTAIAGLHNAADSMLVWNPSTNLVGYRPIPSSGSGTVTSVSFTGGLISVANPTTTPAFTVAGTSGGIPYFSSTSTWASSALLSANALMIGGGAGTAPATTTTGTGVLTALGINVGSAGAFVTFNGALGTPSSGTLTNATGYLWNNIASPTGTQTLSWPDASLNVWTNGSNTETFTAITSNSLTTGIVLSMTSNSQTYGNFENYNSTSTAKVTGNALSVHTSSGANATASVTNLGDSINITNTGTTATNIAMKLGASGAPTANIALQTFAGNVLIGAPTNNTVDGLIIQSPTNTAGQGLRVYANNNSTYTELGYGAILNPGGFAIQSSSATVINLVGSTTYIGAATTATSTLGTLSFAPGYVAKTANYSATISDFTIEVTANSPTITLPTAVGITGRIYYIVNSGAGTVTIATTSSQVFQNVTATPTTLSMATVGATGVQSNGANWLRLSSL